ncbi:trehalose-phosphatase [Candidatus Mycolicibacterium alkanivorans]|uniref:Trehalose-phosphatase n=1 Tax=Candidatus Mycolicibacterium alkanivorans TaxID=2954114 RepID=A0ABS9YVE0_9MYCO|nr:trehalose-phosphatase [Candidatus Mycolicibacterium alkanivorans]MCI4675107.1 trehalose-phosphatase [Candidatus Mycolicibacterium alkanivorans]
MATKGSFGVRSGVVDRDGPDIGLPVTIDPRFHDAVLFDLDGVITDTASLHQAAWAQMFDEFLGRRAPSAAENHDAFTPADYRHFIDGKPRYDGVRDFLASRGISLPWGTPTDEAQDTVCGLGNRKQRLFLAKLAQGVPIFESTVALVRRLNALGVGTAVYSASRNCKTVLESAGIDGLFAVRVDGVTADELGLPGKPDPAVLLETARRLGARPGRCVIVEDAEAGVAAGRAGGFGLVIGVDRTGQSDEDLLRCGADAVIGELADITVRAIDRQMSALPDALLSFGQIAGVVSARRPALFFDFDGTLSEIVDDPAAATLVPGADKALRALAALYPVGVLSGRDLADVRDRIAIPGLWYAGSHGFEMVGPDGTHRENEVAAAAVPVLAQAAEELNAELADIPGVAVEHKRFAVAVHYRNAGPGADAPVTAAVHRAGAKHGLKVTSGRKVVELRPNLDWDKGKTLDWIVDQVTGQEPLLAIYLGDDLTDEDAFDSVLHDGIGIVVRHSEDGDRRTAARYILDSPEHVRDFVERLVEQCDVDRQILSSPWSFTFGGYIPGQERLREALCTVGNGCRATRGCAPEADAGPYHYPGTYAAGLYDRLYDEVAGVRIDNESLVNLPNWLSLKFRIDGGEWFDIDSAKVLSYRQSLDLRQAELTREFRFRDPAGRTCKVMQRRIAAMHLPHACALETTIWAEDWSGTIEFLSVIDGDVRNSGVERYHALSSDHLVATTTRELSPNSALLVCETVQSRIPIAVAARTTLWRGDAPLEAEARFVDEVRRTGHDYVVSLTPGDSVTVEKMVAIFTGRDDAISEPGDAAARLLSGLGRYGDLRDGHVREWAHLWERFDIAFEDNADAMRVVRLHLLQLLQTVPNHAVDLDAGLPARGLHGEAYRGHIFWDELFVFPVLSLRSPASTRSLLRYRYRRLPEARRAAREAGYAGAMFPWQSGSDGREESQKLHLNPNSGHWNPDASARAHHIGIAVAYNVWQYYQITGDLEYLVENGAEMLAEIARFWVSRAEFDEALGRYVIRGVIGPDEFHSGYPDRPFDGIDNNAYTNVMAVWVIVRALDALDALPLRDRLDLMETLGIHGRELATWDEVSRRMYVPFHDGVISQFQGYDQLAELDWHGYRRRYGNIQRLDRILEAENDSVNRYKASKQADVLMLFYLLSSDELRELFARMGYRFTPEQIPKTVDYYLHRTSHGSTLSGVVHAWVLARGDRERAMRYFQQVLMSDVADIQGGTTAEGIHIAAMAGSIDLLQRCFTGLETRADRLILNPMWPESLGALRMPIYYRGYRLHLTIRGRSAEVSVDPADQPAIEIECRGNVQTLTPGTTLRFA